MPNPTTARYLNWSRRPGCTVTWSRLASDYAQTIATASTPKTDRLGRRVRKHREYITQCAVIKWFTLAHRSLGIPDAFLLMHYPAGAHISVLQGSRFKQAGLRPGVPDLQLCVPRWPCPGLWIELKATNGRLSPEQRTMHALLKAQGYQVLVCYSSQQAIDAITQYLAAPALAQPK